MKLEGAKAKLQQAIGLLDAGAIVGDAKIQVPDGGGVAVEAE